MGYGWLPLLVSTLPWSFLFDPIAGQGLHVGGVAGMVLNFVLLVGVYGGMNSLLFVGVVWIGFDFAIYSGLGKQILDATKKRHGIPSRVAQHRTHAVPAIPSS